MRSAIWGLLLALPMVACGDDGTTKSYDAAVRYDAPLSQFDAPPATADARVVDAAPPPDAAVRDAPVIFDARGYDAPIGAAPVIRTVVITHTQPCVAGTASVVTVEIVATDVETTPQNLVYEGTSGSCGPITGRVSTLTCPQFAPYPYTVTVRDSDGNTATTSFNINVCSNTPDAGPP